MTKWDLGRYNGVSDGGHAVVIYSIDQSKNYYKVKNSWGRDWGDDGSFRI
jgi:C1A family cysteine protease